MPAKILRFLPPLLLLVLAFFVEPLPGAEPKIPLDKDHAEKMAKGLVIFEKHIRPILINACLKCHGGEKTEGELEIVERAQLLKGGAAGPAIIPGDAAKSLLYRMIAHQKKPAMPYKQPKLPDDVIAHFENWISLGAPYDKPLVSKNDAVSWTQKVVAPETRQFWSFQPLKVVAAPAGPGSTVDRFIQAKLSEKGLKGNPSATKRQLIRRAYFDLVGVPPSPEEVDAFEKDQSPDAFGKVVDRLLANPGYGERWARHWLDLARFAESHGFEHDYDRPTAYHYRDFVIKALNDDLPFKEFVRWQLAGDEIAPQNPEALKATGFLAAGVHSTQITKNEVEKHRYDELDDMLATTGTAMLGLTFGCARCHDHKFDPIPQADYYKMLSAFTTTVRSEVDLTMNPEKYNTAKAAFDTEHAPLEAALKAFEKDELPKRFAAWETEHAKKTVQLGWVQPEVTSMKSAGGATLTKKEDGSILVSGTNPPIETLTFTLTTDALNINALRLEALSDPSLVKGGPGRAANGNFALTDLNVQIAAKSGGDKKPIVLKNPRATFEQKGLPIAAALDNDPVSSGWAVDPEFGKSHAAAFDFETPAGFPGGSILTVTMKFQNNVGHGMGRPRFSLASSPTALGLTDNGTSEAFTAALQLSPEKRSPEQSAMLLKWYAPLNPEWAELQKKIAEHLRKAPQPEKIKVMVSTEGQPAVRLHTQGDDFLPETHFLRRGDVAQKEGVARVDYLQVLKSADAKHWTKTPPANSKLSYRRTAFADWITDTDKGAGQLLARVIVNRLWQHHLGRGIVATPSDFGNRGEKPSHPELLDYLASELIRNGWQLKPIHRMIMTSTTYAQSSDSDESRAKIDRENSLFWKYPVRRLEAESIRDSLLSVSGLLDPKMYGAGSLDEASRRRSIYFTMKRSRLIPMLTIFDAPDGTTGVGERPATTIAPQALLLLNNPNMRAMAKGLATRIGPDLTSEETVRKGYRLTLARLPNDAELRDGVDFLEGQAKTYRDAKTGRELARVDYCQVLLCLNEFIYAD